MSVLGYRQQHKDKQLAGKAARRLQVMREAQRDVASTTGAGGGLLGAIRMKPAQWFTPLWNMVDPTQPWPIAAQHLEFIRRKVVSQKQHVMTVLNTSGQTGLAKRMAKLYIPAQALQGYIIGRLGRRVEPTTMCASFDDGAKLHAEHGGKGLLAQTCWQCHPGLCVTLDAPILEPCLTFAQRLVSYVRRIGAASQRYLMFVRQIGDLRKHVLVLMAGSSLISSWPRVVYFGQKITELKSPRVRRNTLKCMLCGGAEDHGMHVYHQELLSHHMASQGFALESAVKCQHLSRPGPRLGLQEPAWLTQFSLAKCLQLESGPAVHWACYEATCVNKCGRAGATIVLSDWKYVDLACGGGKAVRPSMAKQKSLDEALKTLPKDAVLTQDMLTMFSALRRTSKTTSGDKPHNAPKRTFERINAGEKSEDSDSSDGVTEATSDSDDGAGQQIVKNAKAKRKAAKRRKQGGDIGV